MKVTVSSFTGRTFFYDVEPTDKISVLHHMIEASKKEPLGFGEYRLMFDGKHLDWELTFAQHEINDGDKLDLMSRQLGMISTFTSNDVSDPLVEYLMMTDDERVRATLPKLRSLLRSKARKEKAKPFITFNYVEDPDILHECQRELLCDLLDFMWNKTARPGDTRIDMRLSMTLDQSLAVSTHPISSNGIQ
ncbi:hypothetical protein ACHAWF_009344 [Thalassiosira exigua]